MTGSTLWKLLDWRSQITESVVVHVGVHCSIERWSKILRQFEGKFVFQTIAIELCKQPKAKRKQQQKRTHKIGISLYWSWLWLLFYQPFGCSKINFVLLKKRQSHSLDVNQNTILSSTQISAETLSWH